MIKQFTLLAILGLLFHRVGFAMENGQQYYKVKIGSSVQYTVNTNIRFGHCHSINGQDSVYQFSAVGRPNLTNRIISIKQCTVRTIMDSCTEVDMDALNIEKVKTVASESEVVFSTKPEELRIQNCDNFRTQIKKSGYYSEPNELMDEDNYLDLEQVQKALENSNPKFSNQYYGNY